MKLLSSWNMAVPTNCTRSVFSHSTSAKYFYEVTISGYKTEKFKINKIYPSVLK